MEGKGRKKEGEGMARRGDIVSVSIDRGRHVTK